VCEFLGMLSCGIDTAKCENSHSLGLWFSPRKRVRFDANLSVVTLAQRGAPGDSDVLEARILVIWFPCILLPCLLPYPSGVDINCDTLPG
jgi:hypothetical protein